MLKSVHQRPGKFGIQPDKMRPFEKLMMQLEGQLLDGLIFQNCVEQTFDSQTVYVTKNPVFAEEFAANIREILPDLEQRIGENNEMDQRYKFVGLCGLYVLHFQIFRVIDKKVFKSMWDVYKKVPCVHLMGNMVWFPTQFLLEKLPQMQKVLDKKAEMAVVSAQSSWLQQRNQMLSRDVQNYHTTVSAWMIEMDSNISQKSLMEDLNNKCVLFIQGLLYANNIKHLVRTVMNLHVALQKPMTRTAVISLCRLIELLKAIEHTFHRRTMLISDYVSHISQHLGFLLLSSISTAKKRITSDKRYSERKLDVLSSLVLAETALNGPGTKERRLILQLALAVGKTMKTFKDDELSTMNGTLRKLDAICDLRESVRKACDCSFLYWHRVVFPIYLTDTFDNLVDPHRMHYMFGALRDCVPPMAAVKHITPTELMERFDKEVYGNLKEYLLDPLCREIETDFRLQIHAHLQLDDRNPFKVGMKDMSQLLKVRPIRFFDRYINIKGNL
ncbi:MRT43 [Mytilus edulis]|uniref:MRT43 n=1 Tax=Mytilus edulis TaxID=6550 RepID=A0A8S3RBW9_MYTED|nr:MRT43 [Mytilus edulis]